MSGSYNEILDNTIYGDGSGTGIVIWGSYHDNLIAGNTVENCFQGMYLYDADNTLFRIILP